MKAFRLLLVSLLLVFVLSTTAFAGLFSGGLKGFTKNLLGGKDTRIEAPCDPLLDNPATSFVTELLYGIQEKGVHGTITALTGVSLSHSYVWVDACGAEIPIDPMWIE